MTLVLSLLFSLLGVLVGVALMRLWTNGSLARVGEAVRLLGRGNFSARVTHRPSGPVGELADEVDRMAASFQNVLAAAAQGTNRLAATLNSSIDGVAAVDTEGRIVFANPALERLLEHGSSEVVGQPVVWLLPDPQVLDAVRASRDHGDRVVHLIERPGRRFLQVATTPIAGGGDWAVLIVLHDLTDVRRAELTRRDFVANVSHELRTPVAALRSVIETLADGAMDDRPVAEEFLRRADIEAERLVQLVEELLELSRIESGELPLNVKPTDAAALISDAVEMLRPAAERRNQELTVALGDGLENLPVDPTRVDRALVNLIQNAIKFTPDAGTIEVTAERVGNELQVSVSDSGIGIAASDLPRVFERFYKVDQSRASGGTGLGLALVKHAVEAHHGSVHAESRLGEGSTFSFTIPLVTSET